MKFKDLKALDYIRKDENILVLILFGLSSLRAFFEIEIAEISERGEFFFFKSWFYFLLAWGDLKLINLFIKEEDKRRRFKMYFVIIPFVVFPFLSEFDRVFFSANFRDGINVFTLPNSLLSFFLLAKGIPKISFFLVFLWKFCFSVLFALKEKFFSVIFIPVISYIVWHIFSLNVIFGSFSPFILLFSAESAYILMGESIALLFLISYRDGRFFLRRVLGLRFFYLILVATIGVFSVGGRDYVRFFSSLASVIPFYLIPFILREEGGFGGRKVVPLIIFFSFISASRGIQVMFVPIVLLFSALYELPPLELKRKSFLASLLYSVFSAFLVFVAHAGAKDSFSFPSEIFQVAFVALAFSFFEFLSSKTKGFLRKSTGFISCVIPSFFFGAPEDILVGVFFGILYVRWELQIFKFLAGAYFTSKYCYMKHIISRDIFG